MTVTKLSDLQYILYINTIILRYTFHEDSIILPLLTSWVSLCSIIIVFQNAICNHKKAHKFKQQLELWLLYTWE